MEVALAEVATELELVLLLVDDDVADDQTKLSSIEIDAEEQVASNVSTNSWILSVPAVQLPRSRLYTPATNSAQAVLLHILTNISESGISSVERLKPESVAHWVVYDSVSSEASPVVSHGSALAAERAATATTRMAAEDFILLSWQPEAPSYKDSQWYESVAAQPVH